MEKLRIVLGSACLAGYPEGGGMWSLFRQYLYGLDALGHDVFWLELLRRSDPERDASLLRTFAERMSASGFTGRWAVAIFNGDAPTGLDALEVHGVSPGHLRRVIADSDILWNFACMLRSPLLQLFRRRALVDLDPGIIHVSALDYDLDLATHHTRFTIGLNVGQPDSTVPLVGGDWVTTPPVVHMPLWSASSPPPSEAKFTSITQWGWGELHLDGRVLSVSKRDAYMHYVDVPRRCGRDFELAANVDRRDPTGDLPRLTAGGWKLVDPQVVAFDPDAYRTYISNSRGEFCCPKPIYRDLRTGWVSDRSLAFLASGRPVIMENTGLDGHLPLGEGLLCFSDPDGAVAAVQEVDGSYERHAEAARDLAQDCFATERVLPRMLERCA
jgi:hypothetical protein